MFVPAIKRNTKTNIMLSNTITSRALEIITANPTTDILEAVKQAIIEENTLIAELLENRSERAQNLTDLMCQKVYYKHNKIPFQDDNV